MIARRRADLPPAGGRTARTRVAPVALLAAAALYAGLASGTRPFTAAADVAVSLPSAFFVGVLLLQRLRPVAGPWRRIDRARPAGGGTAIPWLLVVVLLLAVELGNYFHGGPRADHPTISYGLGVLFQYRAAKAAAWVLWLTVGWHLARR